MELVIHENERNKLIYPGTNLVLYTSSGKNNDFARTEQWSTEGGYDFTMIGYDFARPRLAVNGTDFEMEYDFAWQATKFFTQRMITTHYICLILHLHRSGRKDYHKENKLTLPLALSYNFRIFYFNRNLQFWFFFISVVSSAIASRAVAWLRATWKCQGLVQG